MGLRVMRAPGWYVPWLAGGSLCQIQSPHMFDSVLPMLSLLLVLWEHLRKRHLPAVSAALLQGCVQSAQTQILSHVFPIQVSVSLPVCGNAPFHTGCVLQVLMEIIKPLSAYCPFPVSIATMIKCFFSYISGMPFTSFLPTLQSPSEGGDVYLAASQGRDTYDKDSVLPAHPGQTLEQTG